MATEHDSDSPITRDLDAPFQRSDADRIDYLDAVIESDFAREYKSQAFDLLDVQTDHRVLDVGCGTGDDARSLAARVGSSGQVVGVDNQPAMIAEARRRSEGDDQPVEFEQADAGSLPFADGHFDRTRSDRVLQLIEDRRSVVFEMVRVTRPGGYVVISNPDFTFALDVGGHHLTRTILSVAPALARGFGGIELPNLMADCGLVEIDVRPYSHCWRELAASERVTPMRVLARNAIDRGAVNEADARAWLERVEAAGRAGRFTFASMLFNVRGTVPR